MSDTGRLREALRLYDEAEHKSEVSWPQPPIVAAARRLLAVEERAVPLADRIDYEAAVETYANQRPGVGPVTDRKRVEAIVDAALADISDAVIYPGEPNNE
jgi:hypothetical protein